MEIEKECQCEEGRKEGLGTSPFPLPIPTPSPILSFRVKKINYVVNSFGGPDFSHLVPSSPPPAFDIHFVTLVPDVRIFGEDGGRLHG